MEVEVELSIAELAAAIAVVLFFFGVICLWVVDQMSEAPAAPAYRSQGCEFTYDHKGERWGCKVNEQPST